MGEEHWYIAQLAQIAAAQAEIAAMQAANVMAEKCGRSLEYGEDAFDKVRSGLLQIAVSAAEQW